MTQYSKLGGYTVVPAADLLNLVSSINLRGDGRLGSQNSGTYAGIKVLRDAGSSDYREVFKLGSKSSDAWRVVDGSANYTPVGISTWTVASGCTYSSNLLTADGVDDPTASQVIALKKGTYRLRGQATAEGTSSDYDAPKLVVTAATDGVKVSKIFTGTFHPTAAESATVREAFDYTFTLTVDQNVTIAISNVNEAGALEAGSSYIEFYPLEGVSR